MRLTIAVALLTISTASWGQDETKKPPYSEPPKLELKFQDDFAKDSRGDYIINGKKHAVTWGNAKLSLADGAVLQRKINAGAWVEMKLDLEFPKLTTDGQTSELKIWLDLDESTDSFLWMRQTRSDGKTTSSVSLADSIGNWDENEKLSMEGKSVEFSKNLPDGSWIIEYRYGVWSVNLPGQERRVLGAINNENANVDTVILIPLGSDIHVNTLHLRSSTVPNLNEKEISNLKESKSLNQQVFELWQKGKSKQAIPLAIRSLELRKKTLGQRSFSSAKGYLNLAAQYVQTGSFDLAEEAYLKTMDIYEKIVGRDHPMCAMALSGLASLYETRCIFYEAESCLLRAKKIEESLHGSESLRYANLIGNLGDLYRSMDKFEEAEALLVKSMKIRKNVVGDRHRLYSNSLNNLAVLYEKVGAYEKAEPLYLQALQIDEQGIGKEHIAYATGLNNLAFLYESMQRMDDAERLYLESIRITRNAVGEEHYLYASRIHNLARLYGRIGRMEEALKLSRKSMEVKQAFLGKDHPSLAISLNNLAILYQSMGQFNKAETLLRRSMNLHEKTFGRIHSGYANSLSNLARLFEAKGDYVESQSLFRQVIDIRKRLQETAHPKYANDLHDLAEVHFLMKANDLAEKHALKALSIKFKNSQRYSIIQSEAQQFQDSAGLFGTLGLYLSIIENLPKFHAQGFEFATSDKGRVLANQRSYRTLASDKEMAGIFAQARKVVSRLSSHLRKPRTPDWSAQTVELQSECERLEKRLADRGSQLGIARKFATGSEVALSLPQNSSVINFSEFVNWTPKPGEHQNFEVEIHLAAFIAYNDGQNEPTFNMIDLGQSERINRAISNWRRPIERANSKNLPLDSVAQQAMDQAGMELRRLIWEPVEPHLRESKLVIVSPDGALGRLPLIALPGKKPGTYLLEERKIVYLPVPALLPHMLAKPAVNIDRSSNALMLGNIDYGSNPPSTQGDLLSFRNRRTLTGLRFDSLVKTGKEISVINELFKNATRLTKEKATEQAFQQQLKNHSVLHIATHGFFQSPDGLMKTFSRENQASSIKASEQARVLTKNPNMLSGLAFANANNAASKTIDDAQNDGILYSAEIAMLPMEHVELAVLSACETSLGTDDNPGEGLIGIQRGFQVAGAKSTIASYWKVDDRTTQLLMNKFYENLLEYSKNSKPEDLKKNRTTIRIDALRDAQLWMLKNPIVASATNRGDPVEVDPKKIKKAESMVKPSDKNQRTHPRYWAAFMLSGDWR